MTHPHGFGLLPLCLLAAAVGYGLAQTIDCDLTSQACAATSQPMSTWVRIAPDNSNFATSCITGRFFFNFNRGSSRKLLVYFQGGGAAVDNILWTLQKPTRSADERLPPKILDRSLAGSPFADWNFIHIPYCTGDSHAGNNSNVVNYVALTTGQATGVRHLGARNVRAVLNWLQPNFWDATDLALLGCSAGSLAATIWADQIFNMWPAARRTVVQDGYVPDMGPTPLVVSLLKDKWKICDVPQGTAQQLCLAGGPNYSAFFKALRDQVTANRPDVRLALVSGLLDNTQTSFYQALQPPKPVGRCECQPAVAAAATALATISPASAAQLSGLASLLQTLPVNYCLGPCASAVADGAIPQSPNGLYHKADYYDWANTVLLPAVADQTGTSSFGFMLLGGNVSTTHCTTNSTVFLTSSNFGTNPSTLIGYISSVFRDDFPARLWPTDAQGLVLPGYSAGTNYVITNNCQSGKSGTFHLTAPDGATVTFNNNQR